MRILFFGTGEIAIPTFRTLADDSRHRLIGLITQPDKPVGRHQILQPPAIKRVAEEHRVPVLQPLKMRAPDAVAEVLALAPEVIVVMAYGQILPRAVLDAASVACLNLHASMLPRHRGAAPIQAAIEAGDPESGITVMHMTAQLDAGDILLMKSIAIRRRETGGTLHDRLANLAPLALREGLDLLESGHAPRIPQDAARATYAPKLERENGKIDWTATSSVIERKVRAMNPWPAAFTRIPLRGGVPEKLKVFSAIVHRNDSGPPGTVLRADHRGLLVAAGEGAVLLRDVQLEGRRRMAAHDFLSGHPIAPGVILGCE